MNAYVGKFITVYNSEVKKELGKTPEEIYAMKDDAHKGKAMKKYVSTVRSEVFKRLNQGYLATLPDITRRYYVENVQGQSYMGQSWELKRKCPVCASIYPFRTSSHHNRERPLQEYANVAELDLRKPADVCGICAEALVFVATVWALNLGVPLCRYFGIA